MRSILLALALLATPLFAQPRPVLFYWENDSIGSPLGRASDDDYTNGLRLAVGTNGEPLWAYKVRGFCERVQTGCGSFVSNSAYGFTHQFYTPRNIVRVAAQPRDRPWAGYMYLSASLQLSDENRQHAIEGQLGILGQGAGAQYVQTKWHQLIGASTDPAGWRNQLKNEPVANLLYSYSRRIHSDHVKWADAIVTPGFMLGTLATYPSLSGTVRAGWHPVGFPIPILPERVAPPDGKVSRDTSAQATRDFRTELYAMAGADVRYIVHNSTLDGGFFRDGPSVDRTPLVHDFRLGFSGRLDSFRISYNYVMRSKEFTPPPGRDGNHNYHSLAIGWEPR